LLVCVSLFGQNPQWLWALSGGSSRSDDYVYSIDRDAIGNLYLTGTVASPAYFGDDVLTGEGFCSTEVFVTVILSEGSWAWANRAGGTGADIGHGIAAGTDVSVYITGNNGDAADFGIHSSSRAGAYVAKIDIGEVWESALRFGGDSRDIAVEGFATVVLAYHLFDAKQKFMGSVVLTLDTSMLPQIVMNNAGVGTDYQLWAMEPDGMVVSDQDKPEIGANTFTDPMFQGNESLLELARTISTKASGEGEYSFKAAGKEEVVAKKAYWDTIKIHNKEWRVVLSQKA